MFNSYRSQVSIYGMNLAVLERKLQAADLQHHSPWIRRDNAPKKAGTPPLYRRISEKHLNRSYKLSISFNTIRQMLQFTQYAGFYLSFFISTWTFQDEFSPFKNDTTNSLRTSKRIKPVSTVHAHRLALYIKMIVFILRKTGNTFNEEMQFLMLNVVVHIVVTELKKCRCQEIQNDSNSKWLSSWGFNLSFQTTSTSLRWKPVIPSNMNSFVSVRKILPTCAANQMF